MSSIAMKFAQRAANTPLLHNHQIRFATKKAGGSSNNGRDSAGRRLGIKVFPGLEAKAGSILVRQRGNKFRAGDNVGRGRDHTLFATKPGKVYYTRLETNKKRNVVHVMAEN
jgi:large subunit ribosomal protein L27